MALTAQWPVPGELGPELDALQASLPNKQRGVDVGTEAKVAMQIAERR